MFPPTMIDAPTSEMTPPNPAITAARSGRRASLTRIQIIWMRVAPRARIWSRRFAGRCWIDARVIPVTIGVAMIAWARMIAVGV